MRKTNFIIYISMQVFAWLIFVGLCVEAGGYLVNFIFSIIKPEVVERLYQKLDLSSIFIQSRFDFFLVYSFILTTALLKAFLFYQVILLTFKLDLAKPFNQSAAQLVARISYCTFLVGVLSVIAQQSIKVFKFNDEVTLHLERIWSGGSAFILMAGVIFIIAVIFKKGVEIQHENDLTV